MSKKDYEGVLLEILEDKFDAVLDGIKGIREVVDNQPTRSEFNDLKDDVGTIKAVLLQTNEDVVDLGKRVTVLETKAA